MSICIALFNIYKCYFTNYNIFQSKKKQTTKKKKHITAVDLHYFQWHFRPKYRSCGIVLCNVPLSVVHQR